MPLNFRIDNIWRSILRFFRRWLKYEAIPFKHKDILSQIRARNFKFCSQLLLDAVGNELVVKSTRNEIALLILVGSHRIIKKKKVIGDVAELVEPYKNELWPIFYIIFTQTKKKTRTLFFKEGLVKVLWTRFLQ